MSIHVNDFAPLAATSMPSQHALLRVAQAAGHLDSEQVFVTCEAPDCAKAIALADAYSLAVVYRMPGRGIGAFQCSEEQHFGCCHDHAIAAMLLCVREHITPAREELARAAQGVVSVGPTVDTHLP